MRYLSIILFTFFVTLFMSACSSNDKVTTTTTTDRNTTDTNTTTTDTQSDFYTTVSKVLDQGEDEEPLAITDSVDENSSFDKFL